MEFKIKNLTEKEKENLKFFLLGIKAAREKYDEEYTKNMLIYDYQLPNSKLQEIVETFFNTDLDIIISAEDIILIYEKLKEENEKN